MQLVHLSEVLKAKRQLTVFKSQLHVTRAIPEKLYSKVDPVSPKLFQDEPTQGPSSLSSRKSCPDPDCTLLPGAIKATKCLRVSLCVGVKSDDVDLQVPSWAQSVKFSSYLKTQTPTCPASKVSRPTARLGDLGRLSFHTSLLIVH